MGGKKDLSPRKKGQLRAMIEETTLTQQQIAKKLGLSQTTVCLYLKRLKNMQTYSPRRVGRCGRKRVSSARADRKLVQLCLRGRRSSSRILQSRGFFIGRLDLSPTLKILLRTVLALACTPASPHCC